MTTPRQQTGNLGEIIARRHLELRGYRIIETNYRTRMGEIDIVGEKDGEIVFFEVRTRRSREFGTPEESITKRKQAHLSAAAHQYIDSKGWTTRDWRFDLVAIELGPRNVLKRFEIIENVIEG